MSGYRSLTTVTLRPPSLNSFTESFPDSCAVNTLYDNLIQLSAFNEYI